MTCKNDKCYQATCPAALRIFRFSHSLRMECKIHDEARGNFRVMGSCLPLHSEHLGLPEIVF